MSREKKWFESWFDTPYYHLLYRNRDEHEARSFINRLFEHISLPAGAKVLDLACGKGRHAVYLAQLGLDVTGYDLSPSNISEAGKWANERLRFEIRDMRDDLGKECFDAVFNLFTGFGYFDSDEENFSVFGRISDALKPGGIFVFDYLNPEYVKNLKSEVHESEIEGIKFLTRKFISGKKIVKIIQVKDGSERYGFKEEVTIYSADQIKRELAKQGFRITKQFGNYELQDTDSLNNRLILICKKSE